MIKVPMATDSPVMHLTTSFTISDDAGDEVSFKLGEVVHVVAEAYENTEQSFDRRGKVYVIYSPRLREATIVHEALLVK